MQIEEGKYYRTREGEKVGPAARSGLAEYPWRASATLYTDKGEWEAPGKTHRRDIVAEWDDGPQPPPEGPDAILVVRGDRTAMHLFAMAMNAAGFKAQVLA